MKNYQKTLVLLACAVLLVVGSVFGTFAYLTDTEAVTNTFTVGRVGLNLDEVKVDTMGNVMNGETVFERAEDEELEDYIAKGERVKANSYKLLPGHTYVKDPTVTVDAGSEESYIRMMVTVTFAKALTDDVIATSLDEIFTGYDATKWIRNDKDISEDQKTITYEYRYHTTVTAGETSDLGLEPLFTEIKVPGSYTNEQMAVFASMNINIVAHAIQADGFDTADKAWTAFDAQHNTTND